MEKAVTISPNSIKSIEIEWFANTGVNLLDMNSVKKDLIQSIELETKETVIDIIKAVVTGISYDTLIIEIDYILGSARTTG